MQTASHITLIVFADGTYIELISFRGPVPQTHNFYRSHRCEGIVTYALLSSDIEGDVAGASQRGLALNGPSSGGRLRPDGRRIAWQTATPYTHDLPFLCADVTPRNLRVPAGEARKHRNGATGIIGVTVVVSASPLASERYSALLGIAPLHNSGYPEPPASTAAFQAGEATVTLIEPGGGPMRDYLAERSDEPYSLSLCSAEGTPGCLDAARTHGAKIELVHSA